MDCTVYSHVNRYFKKWKISDAFLK